MAMKKDFGPFELRDKIGSGGMASVYLGVQKSLDRLVVLKVLYPHLAEDEKLVTRFEREARAAAMLRHENIVQVIDCGRFEDLSYIAMEFVEGHDLKRWLELHGPPPLDMALLMLRDICRGLEHAHSHRIVHRDIKPANIMLTRDGTIKIMDFGLARRGEDTTAMTVVGSVLGTPAYMSPEQATGEMVDERADIFSAGVVGYELLGGRRPFLGDTYSTVLREILTVEPPSIATLNPLLPDEVVDIVHKMLHKDASKRYQSSWIVRGDLETVIEQMGLHRGKDLLREYAAEPDRMGEVLRRKRLARHLDQGLYYENMGLGKIDDALREFRRVLHMEPGNAVAIEHLGKLEKERERLTAEQAQPAVEAAPPVAAASAGTQEAAANVARAGRPDETMVMDPALLAEAVAAPAPPPRARTAPQAPPARGGEAAPAVGRRAARDDAGAPARVPAPAPADARERQPRDRTRGLLIAAGALLSLLVVLGVVALARLRDGAAPPSSERSRASATVAAPDTTRTPVVAPQPNPAPVVAAPPASETEPAAPARLVIDTQPAAALVVLDRVARPQRTPATFEQVKPGSHRVRVEKSGFLPQEKVVRLAGGDDRRLSFTLQPQAAPSKPAPSKPAPSKPAPAPPPPPTTGTGTLVVRASPYATYFLDGVEKASNLALTRLTAPAGRRRVRAVHPQLGSREWEVNLEPGQTVELRHDFLAAAGSLRVTSGGVWAKVLLDGEDTGRTTPALFERIPQGTHRIELRREGFSVVGGARTARVRAGEETVASFELKRAR
jgi:tRNA A-37 threonylcarbamoyl transferase component Bud32